MTAVAKTLLVWENDEAVQELLQSIVLDHDLAMQPVFDGEDALRLLDKGNVFAFVFDLRSSAGSPVDFIRNVKQRFPQIPLLGIREPHEGEKVVEWLQSGLYSCMDRGNLAEEFSYNLVKLIANRTDTYNPFSLRYEERLLILPNDFSLVMQVAKTLVESTLPPNEKNRYMLILGLSEIITNAIEHGNLGITYEEKAHALRASRFLALAIDRSHREPYRSRTVVVRSRVLPHAHRLEYSVSDQGQGFDWRGLPNPKEKGNLLSRHGRGIHMARHAFDELRFNDAGNEVTLVVNLDARTRRL